MLPNRRASIALWFTAVCAAMVTFCGFLGRNGLRMPTVADIGPLLLFLGPYLILALAAAIYRGRHNMTPGALLATVALAGMAVVSEVSDTVTFLRTLPGRETQAMLGFLAAIVASLGGLFVIVHSLLAKPLDRT